MMQAKRCVHCMALLKEGGDCPDCGKRQRDRAFSDQHLPLLSTLGSRYQTGLCILQNERMICYTALDMDRQAPCVLCEYFPKDVVYRIHATAHVACLSKADEAVFAKGMNAFQAGAKKQAAAAAAGIAIPIISTFQQNNTVYAGLDMQGLSTLHDQLSFSGLPISHAKARDILIQALYVLQTLHQCNLTGLEISEGSLCMHQNAWKLWYIEKSANLQDIPAAKAAALENPLAADLYQLGMLVCYLVTGKTFDPNLDDNQAIWYHQLYEVILWRPWLEKLLFPEKAGAFQSIGEAIAAVKEAPAVSAASLRQEEIRMVQVGLGTPRNIPKTATVDKRQSSSEKGSHSDGFGIRPIRIRTEPTIREKALKSLLVLLILLLLVLIGFLVFSSMGQPIAPTPPIAIPASPTPLQLFSTPTSPVTAEPSFMPTSQPTKEPAAGTKAPQEILEPMPTVNGFLLDRGLTENLELAIIQGELKNLGYQDIIVNGNCDIETVSALSDLLSQFGYNNIGFGTVLTPQMQQLVKTAPTPTPIPTPTPAPTPTPTPTLTPTPEPTPTCEPSPRPPFPTLYPWLQPRHTIVFVRLPSTRHEVVPALLCEACNIPVPYPPHPYIMTTRG